MQRRTGIEGWFEGPELRHSVDAETGAIRTIGVRSAPVRWKQATAPWLGMLPLNITVSCAVSGIPLIALHAQRSPLTLRVASSLAAHPGQQARHLLD